MRRTPGITQPALALGLPCPHSSSAITCSQPTRSISGTSTDPLCHRHRPEHGPRYEQLETSTSIETRLGPVDCTAVSARHGVQYESRSTHSMQGGHPVIGTHDGCTTDCLVRSALQRSLSVASQEAGDSKASACAAMRVMHTRMLDVRRELSSAHSDSLQQQRQDDARAWGQERASERELHSVKAGEELVAHSAAVSVLQCHISDLQAQLAASVSQAQGAEAQTVAATSEHVQQMLALGGLSKHQLDAAMSGLHCQLQRQRQITGGMAAAADAATHLAGVMDAEMKVRLSTFVQV